ncbi:MAG: efflux RND transporter permease subunit [Bacteroidia bacterium]|nr:efflux RND transporter permease subunit [Bacteroidia bacterium]
MKKGIISASITYRRIIHVAVLLLFAFGIYALSNMNKDEFPSYTLRQGIIAGVYPGASVEEVENQLTKPLEQLLFSMPDINRKNTYSVSKDGIAYVYVDLDLSVKDKDEAWSKIRHKLNEQKSLTFPAGVLGFVVIDDFGNNSSMLIAIESNDKTYKELHSYTNELSKRLQQIPEMGNIKILGERTEEIAVKIDQSKLASYGLNPQTLLLNYASRSLLLPGGNYQVLDFRMPVHINQSIANEKEIEDQIIYALADGSSIRLKDIATVERRYQDLKNDVNFNGKNAIVVSAEMRKGNNIVAFGDEVNKILDDFSKITPQSVKVYRITDQPTVVDKSVSSFLRDLIISMIVVIVVMLMLFPLRTALVASSGLPICTAVSIGLMYLFNIELNTVTLAALIVVLGMVVDDSIINIDGYIDKLQKGYKPFDAAVNSAKELFMPMLISTAAISAMFFPMKLIIKGPLGDFIQLFPWTILFSLASSLIYAMLVIPALEIKFIPTATTQHKPNLFERGQAHFFNLIQDGYDMLQKTCFRHPVITITVGVASILLGIVMFLQLNIQMMPMAERDCFAIEIRLPEGSDISETKVVSDSLQNLLLQDKRIKSVTAFIGEPAPRFHITYAPSMPSNNLAQLIVNTQSADATEELLPLLDEKYSYYFPKAHIRLRQLDYQAVTNPIEIHVLGDDDKNIAEIADKIKSYMLTLNNELRWVHSSNDEYCPSVNINLKPEESARLGISQSFLALNLAGTFNGLPLSSIWEDDIKIPINLYYADYKTDSNYNNIGNQLIPTAIPNTWVPLRQVADASPEWHSSQIIRRFDRDCITVSADMKFWKPQTKSIKKIKQYIKNNIEIPDGVEIKFGGLDTLNGAVIPQILASFIAAVFVLFFFMLLYFKKADISILTIAASSLCLFGAFFGEWLFGLDFGMTSVLGVVSLIGIIVRNGIIMYESAEELRVRKRFSAKEAAMEAGSRRMRPIFLTSATTALGVLPMIISRNPLWMPMGVVICFGVVLSLVIVLSVMPVTYWQIYKHQDSQIQAMPLTNEQETM